GAGGPRMLAGATPPALRVGWALVVAPGLDSCASVARGASAPAWEGAAVPALVDLDRARALRDGETPEQWRAMATALAAAPLSSGHVLVVGRPGGPSFRPSEIARLSYLTGILRSMHAG